MIEWVVMEAWPSKGPCKIRLNLSFNYISNSGKRSWVKRNIGLTICEGQLDRIRVKRWVCKMIVLGHAAIIFYFLMANTICPFHLIIIG